VHGVPYAHYIAPALLASAAMNGAIYDATTNVFWKLRYGKVYDSMLATPLGAVHSWWGLLALPAAMVVGFGFAGVGIGVATFLRSWQDFELVQIVLLPMFLFSGTFYPVSVYPVWLGWIV